MSARRYLRRLLGGLVLALTALPGLLSAAPELPALSGRVVDAAGIIPADTEAALTARLAAEEAESSNQIVVVTLPDLQGYDIADFALQLGRSWGIGQEGKDNGALLVVAVNERKVRIEVGYGLEGFLTDALSSQIIRREILPAFRNNDYPGGIENGVDAMLGAIDGSYTAEPEQDGGIDDGLIPLIFIGLFGLTQLLQRVVGGRHAGHLLFAGMLGFVVSMASGVVLYGIGAGVAMFAFLSLFANKGGGSGGGSTGTLSSGRSGGFGGGGGFSGGGGGFGGGGASGGW
ncbi:TPM domain-containing protein [Granulosicoccaceae sp. 1_MG-2023]|nr:TPM domain-containing protein [Granulosicoccaceae sp. 1_MG-2023]